jgi:hypothetical protein
MTVEGEGSLPLLSRPSLFDRSPRRRRLSSNSGVAAAIEGIGRARVPAGDELAGGFRGLGCAELRLAVNYALYGHELWCCTAALPMAG